MSAERYKPLAGVKVLDLSRLLVGAITTRHLGDLGADVVKVEDPKIGDYLRAIPPHIDGEGIWHHLLDRNKRSIALDIVGSEEDRATIAKLIDAADVVVEVSRPGSLAKLGFDIAELRRQRPELVVCSISGFGQTGDLAMVPAHGLNLDCLAGTTLTYVRPDGQEDFLQQVYASLGQVFGALNGVIGVLAAVVGARDTGQGAWIDISCWDALMDINCTAISYMAVTGRHVKGDVGEMVGSMHRVYTAKDGKKVFIALIEQKFWETFCNAIDRPDLIPAWHGEAGLDYGDPELRVEMEPIMASRTAAEWEQLFRALGLPGSPLLSLDEVMASEHFQDRAMLERFDGDPIPNVAGAIRWIDHDGDRPGSNPRTAPEVGADSDEVLESWLGQV